MKYFIYLFLFGLVVFSLTFGLWWVKNSHKRALKVCLTCFFEKKAHPFSRLNLFLSILIDLTVDFIVKQPRKIQKQMIIELKKGRYALLIKRAQNNAPFLAQSLKALLETKSHHVKSMPEKMHLVSEKFIRCLWFESTFDFEALGGAVQELPGFCFKKKYRVLKKMLSARVLFFKTDLKKASKHLISCAPYFCKKGFLDEGAYCYFLLGEMYRLTQTHDVAEILFNDALKIYQKEENECGVGLIELVKGMLFYERKRFDEAVASLLKAQKLYEFSGDAKALADVLYFLSLSYQGQGDLKKAATIFRKLKKHVKTNHLSFLNAQIDQLEQLSKL